MIKDVLKLIAMGVIALPLLLIVNEGESSIPNFIGLGYAIILMLIAKRKEIKEFFEDLLKSSDNITNRLFK
jgi:hypothetical protein